MFAGIWDYSDVKGEAVLLWPPHYAHGAVIRGRADAQKPTAPSMSKVLTIKKGKIVQFGSTDRKPGTPMNKAPCSTSQPRQSIAAIILSRAEPTCEMGKIEPIPAAASHLFTEDRRRRFLRKGGFSRFYFLERVP
jgi:hypothetical protein